MAIVANALGYLRFYAGCAQCDSCVWPLLSRPWRWSAARAAALPNPESSPFELRYFDGNGRARQRTVPVKLYLPADP